MGELMALKEITSLEFNRIVKDHQRFVKKGDASSRADFSNTNLTMHNLSNLDLWNATFDGALFCDRIIEATSFQDASFNNAKFHFTEFSGCDFAYAELIESDFSHCKFMTSVLRGANFSDAILMGATFKGSDLSRCDFSYSDLTNSVVAGCDTERIKLTWSIRKNAKWDILPK